MKSTILTISLLLPALFAGPALAQGADTPRTEQAQPALGARIQAGLASGLITPAEAQMLIRRDRDIVLRETQQKANGNATAQERQQLRAELSALTADVQRLMARRDMPPPAAGSAPGIDSPAQPISQRIDEGVRLGLISQREARRLKSREREIARHEAFFKSDGVVTQHERRQLRSELDGLRQEVERHINNDPRSRSRS